MPRTSPDSRSLVPVWQNLMILTIASALLHGGSVRVAAQMKTGRPASASLRFPYEDNTVPATGRQATPVPLPRQLTRGETSQLARASQIAMNLSASSDDSFRRGLMPLGDHLRQLTLSYSLRQNVSGFGVGETRQALNARELERYREIVGQLEQFNQPASRGWAGDLALAHTYLARAEAESAYLAGEKGEMLGALNRQVEWSQRQLQSREFDAVLGIATPQAVVEAAQLERRAGLDAMPRNPTPEEYRPAFQAYRDQLQGVADMVKRWSEQGEGIGRVDRLHQVRFELAQTDAVLGTLNKNEMARRTALKTAEKELTALYQAQQEFRARGTASLFDLARTWSDRQSIYDQAADLKGFRSQESIKSHAKDFEQLQQFANQTGDHRGRLAADVEFISALKSEQELVALRNSMTDPFRGNRQ
jgi:hypothetical protein